MHCIIRQPASRPSAMADVSQCAIARIAWFGLFKWLRIHLSQQSTSFQMTMSYCNMKKSVKLCVVRFFYSFKFYGKTRRRFKKLKLCAYSSLSLSVSFTRSLSVSIPLQFTQNANTNYQILAPFHFFIFIFCAVSSSKR